MALSVSWRFLVGSRVGFMGVLAGFAAIVASVVLLMASVASAQAVDPVKLVANLGLGTAGDGVAAVVAQSFTTGSDPGGYVVSEVLLVLSGTTGIDPQGRTFVVIKADAGALGAAGVPGATVADLTSPSRFVDGERNIFTAPAGTVLEPGTRYWLVVNGEDIVSSDWVAVRGTPGNGQSPSGEGAWQIGDESLRGSADGTAWSVVADSLKLKINGNVAAIGAENDGAADGGENGAADAAGDVAADGGEDGAADGGGKAVAGGEDGAAAVAARGAADGGGKDGADRQPRARAKRPSAGCWLCDDDLDEDDMTCILEVSTFELRSSEL